MTAQALQDELEISRMELEQTVKENDTMIAAKDKEISQVNSLVTATGILFGHGVHRGKLNTTVFASASQHPP